MLHTRIERILVIRAGAIGDFVLTLPAIAALRDAFPMAYIEIMGYLSTLELARPRCPDNHIKTGDSFHEALPYADKTTSIEIAGLGHFFARSNLAAAPTPTARIDRRAANAKHSYPPQNLVDYFSSFDLIVAYWRDPAALRDNLRRTGAKKVIAADSFPPTGEPKHVSDHLIEALEQLDIPTTDREPRIYLTEDDREFAQDYLRERSLISTINVAVHPGSGGITKTWPPERFAKVVQWFIEDHDAEVIIVSGPADEEVTKLVLEDLPDSLRRRTIEANDLSLRQLAAVLERCRCFVGNDSGVTHIAAAVSTPTVAIFGPTDPEVWGPRGSNVQIVKSTAPCSPCSREDRLACQNRVCLAQISVERILEALVTANGREFFASIRE